ncbi:type II secretion system protein GspL [Sulfurirhabdus autotrophica]|uniref:Type II secretion system protein L (GspL) n=1 Tax=Sulfurirhabdus autotrophica TaxID=1706046 RepID=A0A4R3XUP1_9PROT|nr:type II secretion system protein GspL [Sulfurirhabdus autotrophica]TCV83415.1 type II secretion system protein L (GspL) [Sulfurirhabdus autotrophica]
MGQHLSLLQIYIPEHFAENTVATIVQSTGGSESEVGVESSDKSLCQWVLRDTQGRIVHRGDSPLSAIPKADNVQVVVPASMVLLAQVRVPTRNRRKMLQLLPYAVEEKLMYDPDAIHVAAGPQLLNGETVVALIDKGWMKRVLSELQSNGLLPRQMLPETLLPCVSPGKWTMVWNGREGFVRKDSVSGSSIDGGNLETPPLGLMLAVKEAAAKGNAPQKIRLQLTKGAEMPSLESWATKLDVAVSLEPIWEWYSATDKLDKGINLLQGEFAPAGFNSDWLTKYKLPLILAGLILLLQFGGGITEWSILTYQKHQLENQIQQFFHQAFPEAKVIVDAPLQMQRNLAQLRHAKGLSDPTDFLPMLAKVVPLLSQSGMVIAQDLQYDNGILKISLQLKASQTAEQIRSRFQNAGVKMEVEKIEVLKSGGIIAHLIVKGGVS